MAMSRWGAAVAGGLVASIAVAQAPGGPRETLVVATENGPREFQVEIADDGQERSKGLMFRREMADDAGMLFDFKSDQPVGFWMENTYIPLDMIFIKADGTVAAIAERTTPLSRRTVPSGTPVRFVLEINGGLSDELGISPGDKVSGPAFEARP